MPKLEDSPQRTLTERGLVQWPEPVDVVEEPPASALINIGGESLFIQGLDPTRIAPFVARLNEVSRLQQGWDSYTATTVSPGSVTNSLLFVCDTLSDDLPLPVVRPVSTGTIQLEWQKQNGDVEVEIGPDGRYSMFVDDGGQESEYAGQVQSPSSDAVAALREFFR